MRLPALWLALAVGCVPRLVSPGDDTASAYVPPQNQWASTTDVPDNLRGQGFSQGQVIPDFQLLDQHGDTVSAWQFYGSVLAIDVSTLWCAPCQKLADEVHVVQADYESEGFIYITLLSQDMSGDVPDVAELNTWVDDHGISNAPVLSDGGGFSAQITPGGVFPQVVIVGRDMAVTNPGVNPAEDRTIRAAIEAAL
jgi:hypothetical protein